MDFGEGGALCTGPAVLAYFNRANRVGNGNQPEIREFSGSDSENLVNSSLVSSKTRKELFWLGFPGLVWFIFSLKGRTSKA